jgi:hypothetical protein
MTERTAKRIDPNPPPPFKDTVNLVLRLPADMHQRLVASAQTRRPSNSLNREILQRIEEGFAREDTQRRMSSALVGDPELFSLWSSMLEEGTISKEFMNRMLEVTRGDK